MTPDQYLLSITFFFALTAGGLFWLARRRSPPEERRTWLHPRRAQLGANAGAGKALDLRRLPEKRLLALLRERKMDEAIDLYRRSTGADYYTARDAVEALRRKAGL